MNEYPNLCPGCMHTVSEDTVICPECSYNCFSQQPAPYLSEKTVIVGRYIVGKVLFDSGNIVTYLAYDNIEKCVVELNEFLPKALVSRSCGESKVTVLSQYEQVYRDGMNNFEKLWRTLQGFQNTVVAGNITDIFYFGATAYCVRDHFDCCTLKEYYKRRTSLLTFEKTMSVFTPVMILLERLHAAGIIHGAVTDETLLVRPDGKIRLSGFSVSIYGGKNSITPVDGYSPLELYHDTAHLCNASDVYGIAALMYTALTGIVPPRADRRDPSSDIGFPAAICAALPEGAGAAFSDALTVIPAQRTASFEAFRARLSFGNKKAPAEKPAEPPVKTEGPPVQKKEEEPTPKPEETEEEKSVLAIAFEVFITSMLVIVIVFCSLYTTVLYKYIEIPFIESAFGSFSFLPMNSDSEAETTVADTLPAMQTTGEKLVTMIDFSGKTYAEIKQNAVYNRDYTIEYNFHDSETVPADTVISQSIAPGEKVSVGTTVVIEISSGKPKIVLRDVIGMNYNTAYDLLTQDGFVVEKNVLENDGAQKSGEVFSMSLVAGLEFEKGTHITLDVWGLKPGEEEETTRRIPGIFGLFGE